MSLEGFDKNINKLGNMDNCLKKCRKIYASSNSVSIAIIQSLSHLVILWFVDNLSWQGSLGIGSISETIAEGIKVQGKICITKQETALINKASKENSYQNSKDCYTHWREILSEYDTSQNKHTHTYTHPKNAKVAISHRNKKENEDVGLNLLQSLCYGG